MNIELVAPRLGLIESIVRRLRPEGKNYSGTWVVFPERRPGYYLREALAEKERSGFIPPRVDSFDGFVGRVYEEGLKIIDTPIDPLDAIKILFEIHKSSDGRLGGKPFLSPDGFFHLGAKMFQDLESLMEAGVTADALRRLDHVTEEGRKTRIPPKAWGRLQSLSFFYERFYAEVRDKGFSTPASRLRDVASRISADLFPDIREFIFAGFFALTESEKNLLAAVMRWPNARFLFLDGRGINAALEAFGIDPASVSRPAAGTEAKPVLSFIKSPDTHGQVFALNGLLEKKLATAAGSLDDRDVIVLPAAETLFPLYHQTLAVLGEDEYNISMGYPLSRTPLFTFFDKLLEALQSRDAEGRFYGPQYLRFVLHPYTKNIYYLSSAEKRSDLTRVLFHAIEDEFTRRRMKAFWSLKELERDPAIWKAVQGMAATLDRPPAVVDLQAHLHAIHERTFRPFDDIRNVADFAHKTIDVLNYVYENSTARLHRFFHPFSETLLRRLESLGRSEFGDVAFEATSSYFNLFRKVVAAGVVPFAGTPLRGLQVLGFWETRGIPFKKVFLLDANEGLVPSFKRSDTLLPAAVRRELKLPTYTDLERRMEYCLDTLVRGAAEVRLFFVENKDKEKSRFVEKLIWERQKEDGRTDARVHVQGFQYKVKLRAENPPPVPKTPEMVAFLEGFRYSASALNAYLSCPLNFYYAYVLNVREKETVDEAVDRKDVGTLVHEILNRYFERFVGKPLKPEALKESDLDEAVELHFRERYGEEQRGGIFLMKHQVLRHLRDFLRLYQIPVIEKLPGKKITILELESLKNLDMPVGGATRKIAAKMDRAEARGDELFVLDYKTGASDAYLKINFKKLDAVADRDLVESPRDACAGIVRNIQLPLYNLVYAHLHRKAREKVRCRFVMLGKNSLGPEIEFSPFKEDDDGLRAAQIAKMELIIAGLMNEIADPARHFMPAADTESCADCPYAYLCDRKI